MEEYEFNKMERSYSGPQGEITNIPSESGAAVYANNDNTDPNYAYIVENDRPIQGAILAENEYRWYAFVLNEKSKATILLEMVQSLDADLYLFQLNGSSLGLVGGSATAGAGITEYYTQVLEPGTYFFAVAGYSGTGNFAFAYYQSSADAAYEVNDTLAAAAAVEMNKDIVGVMDNPNDLDYYKITVNSPVMLEYSIESSEGYVLEFKGADSIEPVLMFKDWNYLRKGTYYFAVGSPDRSYASNSPYTIRFKKTSMASPAIAPFTLVCQEAGIVYQTNHTKTIHYVNGNRIDINYRWKEDDSNAYGSQSYDVGIEDNGELWVDENPEAVYYHSSTKPSMKVSERPALAMTFKGPMGFYYMHCTCTGSYAQNNLWQDMNNVTVLIDPETGKLIDILEFNYFYDYNTIGNNFIIMLRQYKDMDGYYNANQQQ